MLDLGALWEPLPAGGLLTEVTDDVTHLLAGDAARRRTALVAGACEAALVRINRSRLAAQTVALEAGKDEIVAYITPDLNTKEALQNVFKEEKRSIMMTVVAGAKKLVKANTSKRLFS